MIKVLFLTGFLLLGKTSHAHGVKLLSNGWRHALLTVTAASMVYGGTVFPTRVAADPNILPQLEEQVTPEWRPVVSHSLAEHQSVFHLRANLLGKGSIEHLVYLGTDRKGKEAFVSMRPSSLSYAHDYRKLLNAEVEYSFYAWNGLVQDNVVVEQEKIFSIPDLDFYDLAIIKIEGLEFVDATPVRLAAFPQSGAHLNLVSYLPDGHDAFDQPPPDFDLSLYWQRCHAGDITKGMLLGNHSCIADNAFSQGAAIFETTTGYLVGFYFGKLEAHERQGIVKIEKALQIPDEFLRYYTAFFTVSPIDKLSTMWGEVKGGS